MPRPHQTRVPAGPISSSGQSNIRVFQVSSGVVSLIRQPRSSRFSLLASRFSLLASRFSLLASRFSLLASRFSLLASRFSLLASRFSLLASHISCPALSVTTKQASNSSTDQGGGKRRSVTACCHIAMPQGALTWAWRGRRHARFHAHFRLHRTRYSDCLYGRGSSEGYFAGQAVMPCSP